MNTEPVKAPGFERLIKMRLWEPPPQKKCQECTERGALGKHTQGFCQPLLPPQRQKHGWDRKRAVRACSFGPWVGLWPLVFAAWQSPCRSLPTLEGVRLPPQEVKALRSSEAEQS